MKKLLLTSFLLLLLFNACDNIPSEVIESADPDYRIVAVNAPTEFTQTPTDSIFTTSIRFENTETISSVWFNIVTDDGTATIKQNVLMLDDGNSSNGDLIEGDGAYSGRTVLGNSVSSGTYVVEYYVENNVGSEDDNIQLIASQNFYLRSYSENYPPVISNPTIPDTVIIESPNTEVTLTLEVKDPNGVFDLKNVYFYLFVPNTDDSTKINMVDDGVTETSGDDTAGDGIYSTRYTFSPSDQRGEYKLVFQAEDNLGLKSNKETRYIFATDNNEPPQLSNLTFPDVVNKGKQFQFSVQANDPNGLVDIRRVYYEVYDPDGNQIQNSQGITKFPMFDDGSTGGDNTAKDGIYTVALTFPESFAAGDYKFEITAEDNFGKLSNTIIHTLTVQ